jgi:hypothetical protein
MTLSHRATKENKMSVADKTTPTNELIEPEMTTIATLKANNKKQEGLFLQSGDRIFAK